MNTSSDEEGIRNLLARYCHLVDRRATEEWLSLFTDDIVWDGGPFGHYEGKTQLAALTKADYGEVRHFMVNTVVDVRGNEALASSYLQIVRRKGAGDLRTALIGRYEIALRKVGKDWLIAKLDLTHDLY